MDSLIIGNPRGNQAAAIAMCDIVRTRTHELLEVFNGIEVTAENYDSEDIQNAVKHFSEAVEQLRDLGKTMVAEIVEDCEAKRVLTQIDSRLYSYSMKADPECSYAKLSAALKAKKEQIAAFKAAALPPVPTHTYLVRLTCTDRVLDKLLKAAIKEGAVDPCWCVPQTDKAVKAAQRIFEENV